MLRATLICLSLAAALAPSLLARTLQGQTAATADTDLYLTAFRAAAEERMRVYSRLGGDYKNLIVVWDFTTDSFPVQIGPFTITVLGDGRLCERFKKIGKFPVLAVRPMRAVQDRLKVNVLDYQYSCKKNQNLYELSGGAEVTFRIDAASARFVLESVELGGV